MAELAPDVARGVALAVFDVDGVLTDGRIVVGPDGGEWKRFHVRDGLGGVDEADVPQRSRHPRPVPQLLEKRVGLLLAGEGLLEFAEELVDVPDVAEGRGHG